MARLDADAMLILWSAPTQRYSADIDYEYRQDSNLYYLTGLTQDGTILVLMPGNASRREILFIKDRDPLREHWEGRRLSVEEAERLTAIETVLLASQFEPVVTALLAGRSTDVISTQDAARFQAALAGGRARLALSLENGRSLTDALSPALQFAQKVRDRFVGFTTIDAAPVLEDLRTVKTPYERKVLARSLEISSEAQLAGMRAARPGAYEYEVKAAIEAVHRGRGAASWSYPSIVGSGPNATILHYPDGDRQMQTGELLLVDAACNYGYMSGDITRTYPVDGTFTDAQKDLYRLVLQSQEAGIAAAKPGASLQDVHARTVEVMKAGLLKLGLSPTRPATNTSCGTRMARRTSSASTCMTSATEPVRCGREWCSPSSQGSTFVRVRSTRFHARPRTSHLSRRFSPPSGSMRIPACASRIRFSSRKLDYAICRPQSRRPSTRLKPSFAHNQQKPSRGDNACLDCIVLVVFEPSCVRPLPSAAPWVKRHAPTRATSSGR